jgi:hypothetical protein
MKFLEAVILVTVVGSQDLFTALREGPVQIAMRHGQHCRTNDAEGIMEKSAPRCPLGGSH